MASCSRLSPAYMIHATVSCRLSLMHEEAKAFIFALLKAGRSIAARIAMMAITTSSSINVNPARRHFIKFRRSKLFTARPTTRRAGSGSILSRLDQAEERIAAGWPVGLADEAIGWI